jgi:hypothetical protein
MTLDWVYLDVVKIFLPMGMYTVPIIYSLEVHILYGY